MTLASRFMPRAMRGFTVVELMITVTIFAILAAIAVPSFKDATLGSQVRSMANALVGSAALARSEAIKRNKAVTLCSSTDGTTCDGTSWQNGWIITQGGQVIQREPAVSNGFKITENSGTTSISFSAIGVGVTPASLKVCRATPKIGKQGRRVTLDASGRAWVKTLSAVTVCT